VLDVPTELWGEVSIAARDLGIGVDEYLSWTLMLGHRMRLVQGAVRLPDRSRIDPLLAEAVHRAAAGKPWEHKADLLLAVPSGLEGGRTPPPLRDAPVPSARSVADNLLASYGLVVSVPSVRSMAAEIGGEAVTRNQLLALLAIWDDAGRGWSDRRAIDVAESAGLPSRTVEPALRRLLERGLLESKPNPSHVRGGTLRSARNLLRVREAAAVWLEGLPVKRTPASA
jgi:DNA-binding MarR family transcriptional regulator